MRNRFVVVLVVGGVLLATGSLDGALMIRPQIPGDTRVIRRKPLPRHVAQMPTRGSSNGEFRLHPSVVLNAWSGLQVDAIRRRSDAGQVVVSSSVNPAASPALDSRGFQPTPGPGPLRLGSFHVVINPGPNLAGNAPALAAFNRAAALWEQWIADPITVTIQAEITNLNDPSIIGIADAVLLTNSYDTIRNAMVADAAAETDDAIVASLPTAAQFDAMLPMGFNLSGNLGATKANLKALGFTGLDARFGSTDGTITFNSQYSFDFDNSDGVKGTDFETIAAHEIGHALGFFSEVDSIDNQIEDGETDTVSPSTLDLFRFEDDQTGQDPDHEADFTTFSRTLVPGDNAIIDTVLDPTSEHRMSTGFHNGDGRQASHWKDNEITLNLIGIMDPTLGPGQIFPITDADRRALDLIGYDIIPEPASMTILLLGLASLPRRPHLRLV